LAVVVFVDSRAGSHELVKPLRALGLPVTEQILTSGDVMFEGKGEQGKLVTIGIEYKKLGELVGSLRSERLQGHQLLKMQREFDFIYLLIEGTIAYEPPNGMLLDLRRRKSPRVLPGRMSLSELFKRLHTLQLRGGLTPLWATGISCSCLQIETLYRVWTDRNLDAHTSHIAIYRPPPLVPISEFRVFIQSIDGIGFDTSKAAEAHFQGNVRAAVNASAAEWLQIKGIGPKLAQHIQDVFEGRTR
jgi:hypothetical protein